MNKKTFHSFFEVNRPPDPLNQNDRHLADIAWDLQRIMEKTRFSFFNPHRQLASEKLACLASAATEMAEDLHADIGLWRSLEQYQQMEFGVPLPLVMRPNDPSLSLFDERRFLFLFTTLLRVFEPDRTFSPRHQDILLLSRVTRDFLEKAFQSKPGESSIRTFLSSSNTFGWDIKRKLIWLGRHSYLFRDFFTAYMMDHEAKLSDIPSTDDFLCQECTAWMGLGVIDILASVLDLPASQRMELRGWYERHASFYQILSLETTGRRIDTLSVVNIINDQPYLIRVEMENTPFCAGKIMFGSLVPWRGEWYWSGLQMDYSKIKTKPGMIDEIKKSFLEKNSCIAYRFCPVLAEKARISMNEHHAKWLVHYGQELVVFPDGLSLAASEQKRMKAAFQAMDPTKIAEAMKTHGLKNPCPQMHYPKDILEHEDGIGAFSNPSEGVEFMLHFSTLLRAFKKQGKDLLQDELETIYGFFSSKSISPAFVRRMVREYGTKSIGQTFMIEDFREMPDLEFLLRRFKGAHFRKRYPAISFIGNNNI